MTGWKDWQIGEVVTESDFQNLVQDQVVQRYADAATRTSTLGTAIAEGMVSYLEDTNSFEVYDGSAWVGLAGGFTVSDTAPSAPSEGDTWYNSTNGNLYTYYDSYWVETSAPAQNISAVAVTAPITNSGTSTNAVIGIDENVLVGRNYIINGAFDIWQRGTSFPFPVASDTFFADRIYQTNIAGWEINRRTDVPDGFVYSAELGSTSGSTIRVRTPLEQNEVIPLRGKTMTYSIYAKKGATFAGNDLSWSVRYSNSTDARASQTTTITTDAFSITSSWARYSVTFTVPSDAVGMELGWLLAGQSTGNSVFTTGWQLEAGSVATPFRRHAPSLQGELAACQRYYIDFRTSSGNHSLGFGYAASTTQIRYSFIMPVEMRTTPSLVVNAANDVRFRHQGGELSPTAHSVTAMSQGIVQITATVSGATANYPAIVAGPTPANIALNAEL